MKVQFFHIHKTGGTSLRNMLTDAIGPENLDARVGPWPAFEHRDGLLITLLREPVSRLISHFNHAQARWTFEGPWHNPQFTIWDFLRCGSKDCEANLQAFYLAGSYSSLGNSAEEILRRARVSLLACDLVGVTERFDDFAKSLGRILGVRLRPRRDNVARPGGVASDKMGGGELQALRGTCWMDYEIYALAERLAARDRRRSYWRHGSSPVSAV